MRYLKQYQLGKSINVWCVSVFVSNPVAAGLQWPLTQVRNISQLIRRSERCCGNKIRNWSHHRNHAAFTVPDKSRARLNLVNSALAVYSKPRSNQSVTGPHDIPVVIKPPCVLYRPRNQHPLVRELWTREHDGSEDHHRGLCPLFGTVHHHKWQTDRPSARLLQDRLVRLQPCLTSTNNRGTPCDDTVFSFGGQAGRSSMSSSSNSHRVTD